MPQDPSQLHFEMHNAHFNSMHYLDGDQQLLCIWMNENNNCYSYIALQSLVPRSGNIVMVSGG